MQAGVPVIASNIPGNRELIQHDITGLLYPVGNVDDLTRLSNQLLNDEARRRTLATNAQKRLTRIPLPKKFQGVKTSFEGETIVLRGEVSTESQKRLVERLVKLEPGIDSVRNEVKVLTNPSERIEARPTR